MRKLARIFERTIDMTGYFSGWLVVVMIALVMVEVLMRYIVRQPLSIADEISAYMLVALSFIGMAYCWKQKGHVRIEALVCRLPARVANWMRLVSLTIGFVFTIVLCQGSYIFLLRSFEVHKTSNSWLRIPLLWPQMTIGIGYALLSLWLLLEIVKAIRSIRTNTRIEGSLQ